MVALIAIILTTIGLAHAQTNAVASINQQIASNPGHLDFLIQNVCVDGSDNIIEGDPAVCPRQRNIRIGERVPYLLTDTDYGGLTYQALSSYPVVGTDGQLKVMVAKNMQTRFDANFRFDFSEARDGYDLIDATGAHISAIRTSDGGCFDQKFSASSRQRSGGWVFFSRDLRGGSLVHSILLERLSPQRPPSCEAVGRSDNVHAVWNAPTPTAFESGKVLPAIASYHFAHRDLARKNNALERFFFTREYGFTRWEAWIPLSRCQEDFAVTPQRCDPSHIEGRCGSSAPVAGTATWGNQAWVRVDCRDSTNYIPVNQPFIPLTEQMGTRNGLVDVDVASVLGGRSAEGPVPESRELGSWSGNGPGSFHLPGVGTAYGNGWQVPALGRETVVTYGPYVTGLPAGDLVVEFTLEVDDATRDNRPVARVDVFRNSTQTLLGQMTITRREFGRSAAPQVFSLPFTYDGVGELEFRVTSIGPAGLTHVETRVRSN
jgi:hypothetical protein